MTNPNGFLPITIGTVQNSKKISLPVVELNGFEWRIFHRPVNTMAQK